MKIAIVNALDVTTPSGIHPTPSAERTVRNSGHLEPPTWDLRLKDSV